MIFWVLAVLMPPLGITDPLICCEAIDEATARLIYPFGKDEDKLTIYF